MSVRISRRHYAVSAQKMHRHHAMSAWFLRRHQKRVSALTTPERRRHGPNVCDRHTKNAQIVDLVVCVRKAEAFSSPLPLLIFFLYREPPIQQGQQGKAPAARPADGGASSPANTTEMDGSHRRPQERLRGLGDAWVLAGVRSGRHGAIWWHGAASWGWRSMPQGTRVGRTMAGCTNVVRGSLHAKLVRG